MRNTLFFEERTPEQALEKLTLTSVGITSPLFFSEQGVPLGFDIYLHGLCCMFALALHEEFGYPIYVAAELDYEGIPWSNRLVHAYCRINDLLFDVRGATDDQYRFFDEFSDFLGNNFDNILVSPADLWLLIHEDIPDVQVSSFYEKAKEYIRINRDAFALSDTIYLP